MEPVDFATLLSQKLDNLSLDRQGRALLDRQDRSEADKMVCVKHILLLYKKYSVSLIY